MADFDDNSAHKSKFIGKLRKAYAAVALTVGAGVTCAGGVMVGHGLEHEHKAQTVEIARAAEKKIEAGNIPSQDELRAMVDARKNETVKEQGAALLFSGICLTGLGTALGRRKN